MSVSWYHHVIQTDVGVGQVLLLAKTAEAAAAEVAAPMKALAARCVCPFLSICVCMLPPTM